MEYDNIVCNDWILRTLTCVHVHLRPHHNNNHCSLLWSAVLFDVASCIHLQLIHLLCLLWPFISYCTLYISTIDRIPVWLSFDLLLSLVHHKKNPLSSWLRVFITFCSLIFLWIATKKNSLYIYILCVELTSNFIFFHLNTINCEFNERR